MGARGVHGQGEDRSTQRVAKDTAVTRAASVVASEVDMAWPAARLGPWDYLLRLQCCQILTRIHITQPHSLKTTAIFEAFTANYKKN
jgi:hypothetical protein